MTNHLLPKRRPRVAVLVLVAILAGILWFAIANTAEAAARCTSSGSPALTAGRFENDAPSTIIGYVTGEKLVSGAFVVVKRSVLAGQTAWSPHKVCDADFVKFNTAVRYQTLISSTVYPSGTCFKITGGSPMRVYVSGGQYTINYRTVVASSYCL